MSKNCPKTTEIRLFVSELLSKKTSIMATLSLTILPAKALKGGRHKIRVAVAHNATTRYILTDVIIDSESQWKNGRVVKRDDAAYLNTKLRKKVNEVQNAIDELDYIEGLSCAELIESIQQERERTAKTLEQVFSEMMQLSNIKHTTLDWYNRIFASISTYIPGTTLVQRVTPQMVMTYIKGKKSLAPITMKMHITLLSRIITFAMTHGYADFRVSPTQGLLGKVVAVRNNWLTIEQVRFMRDHKFKHKAYQRFADYFMISYYLGGINMIDLVQINFAENMEKVKYIRSKTKNKPKINKYVEFDVPEEAKPLITRRMKPDGSLRLFNVADEFQGHQMDNVCRRMRGGLGIPELTYYSARKSFAQHAFMLGISESVIDYILGHSLGASNGSSLYSYIKVTPDMATAAIRKVLDFLAGTNNFDNFAEQSNQS